MAILHVCSFFQNQGTYRRACTFGVALIENASFLTAKSRNEIKLILMFPGTQITILYLYLPFHIFLLCVNLNSSCMVHPLYNCVLNKTLLLRNCVCFRSVSWTKLSCFFVRYVSKVMFVSVVNSTVLFLMSHARRQYICVWITPVTFHPHRQIQWPCNKK